jgi:hypothetical protein
LRALLTINEPTAIGDEALVSVRQAQRVHLVDAVAVATWALDHHDEISPPDRGSDDQFLLPVDPGFDGRMFGV